MCGWTATISDALAAVVGVVFLGLLPCALRCSLVPSFTEGRAVEGAFPTQGAHTYKILWFLSCPPTTKCFQERWHHVHIPSRSGWRGIAFCAMEKKSFLKS